MDGIPVYGNEKINLIWAPPDGYKAFNIALVKIS